MESEERGKTMLEKEVAMKSKIRSVPDLEETLNRLVMKKNLSVNANEDRASYLSQVTTSDGLFTDKFLKHVSSLYLAFAFNT